MFTHSWEAMGTLWHISLFATNDQAATLDTLWKKLEQESQHFEQQFSRFIATSEVNQFREPGTRGDFEVSTQLGDLLRFATTWKEKTNNAFDPAVGGLLELAGYNPTYSFEPQQSEIEKWKSPRWSISSSNIFSIEGPLIIDIGGYGKGYWIDQLSHLLLQAGYPYHLVDGGGDMYATTKPDESGWRIALEVPGKPELALEVLTLKNKGLAVSDTLKRRWGEWHHVVVPNTGRSSEILTYAAVVAPRAVVADVLTTCLMVTPPHTWVNFLPTTDVAFITKQTQGPYTVSDGWTGEILDN